MCSIYHLIRTQGMKWHLSLYYCRWREDILFLSLWYSFHWDLEGTAASSITSETLTMSINLCLWNLQEGRFFFFHLESWYGVTITQVSRLADQRAECFLFCSLWVHSIHQESFTRPWFSPNLDCSFLASRLWLSRLKILKKRSSLFIFQFLLSLLVFWLLKISFPF